MVPEPLLDIALRAALDPRWLPGSAKVLAAMVLQGGNVSAASQALGLHRTRLYRLMRR